MLSICPSLRAAPRIFDSFATIRSMLPALNIIEPLSWLPVARRKPSPTAPNAIEVARPPYCHNLPSREDGTRDSSIWYTCCSLASLVVLSLGTTSSATLAASSSISCASDFGVTGETGLGASWTDCLGFAASFQSLFGGGCPDIMRDTLGLWKRP